MTQAKPLVIAVVILFTTVQRSPAPIQEIPESPSPTPVISTPESKKTVARAKEKKSTTHSESGTPVPAPATETLSKEANSIPKGAAHLVIHTEADARKIFTYFRFPPAVAKPGSTGLYRVEVSPEGNVAAVTILKSMGYDQDLLYMKAFATWKAAPGPLRFVDLPRRNFQYYHVTH